MNNFPYKKTFLFLVASLFVYMLLINFLQPYTADEFNYSFISGSNEKVNNIVDILQSQYHLFFSWTGRNVVHFLLQFLLWVGKPLFAIINAGMFIALVILIMNFIKLRTYNKLNDITSFIVITGLCWFGLPAFGETVIWEAGALNYLWVAVISLAFLMPYKYYVEGNQIFSDNLKNIVIMILLGFFAGWSHENQAVLNIGFICIIYIYIKAVLKVKKTPKWMYAGIISLMCGSALLILAPGNYVRESTTQYNFKNVLNSYWLTYNEQKLIFIALLVCIILFLFKRLISSDVDNNKTLIFGALLLSGLGSLGSLIVIASFPPRATFAAGVIFITAICYLVDFEKMNIGLIRLVNVLIIVFLINSMVYVYKQYNILHFENEERMAIVNENISEGNLDVKLPLYQKVKFNKHMFGWDLTLDKDHYYNTIMSKYYGLNSIKGTYGNKVTSNTQIKILFDHVVNDGLFEVYYDLGQGINNNHKYGEQIKSKENINSFAAPLPSLENIRSLRLYFGGESKEFIVSKVLFDISGNTFELNPHQIIELLSDSDGVEEITIDNKKLIITSGDGGALLEINDVKRVLELYSEVNNYDIY